MYNCLNIFYHWLQYFKLIQVNSFFLKYVGIYFHSSPLASMTMYGFFEMKSFIVTIDIVLDYET